MGVLLIIEYTELIADKFWGNRWFIILKFVAYYSIISFDYLVYVLSEETLITLLELQQLK